MAFFVGRLLGLLQDGVTHLGVATDHIIESFRNRLWPTHKSSAGLEHRLLAQFGLLELALEAMGVVVWPMVELEADDALTGAAAVADDPRVEQVVICPPDKGGFGPDFGWIHLPVLGEDGLPVHECGVSPTLDFLGLFFLSAFALSLIGGVGRDARHIASRSSHVGRLSGRGHQVQAVTCACVSASACSTPHRCGAGRGAARCPRARRQERCGPRASEGMPPGRRRPGRACRCRRASR
jgi:5'-3' exonuclease, N-terminal resolvase-like domain